MSEKCKKRQKHQGGKNLPRKKKPRRLRDNAGLKVMQYSSGFLWSSSHDSKSLTSLVPTWPGFADATTALKPKYIK